MFVLSSTFYFSKKTTHTQEREREKSLLSVSQNHSFVLSPSKNVRFRFFSISPKDDSSLRQQKKKKMSANGQKTTSRALCLSVFSEPCCRIGRRFFSRRHTRRGGGGGGGGIRRDETKGNTKHHHLRRTTHKKEYLSRRSSTTYPQFENVAFHLDQKNADGEQSKRHEASHHVHRGPARHRVADRRGKPNQGALQGEHLFLSLRLSLSLFCKRAFSFANCDDE